MDKDNGRNGQYGRYGLDGQNSPEPLIPRHGGYRKLKGFQVAQYSRTKDQMVQAARSGVQNIAEGSQASGTSKKTELKLTNDNGYNGRSVE